ncbi:MAG: radical SAM protein [Acidobacteriota bacterium]
MTTDQAIARSPAARDRQVRALRPTKPAVDVTRPHGVALEDERLVDGRVARALTVFLAGRECPFTCVFCDLWRYTTDDPTPDGAIPAQLRAALADPRVRAEPTPPRIVKLYNASNYFDDRAVPTRDDDAVIDLVAPANDPATRDRRIVVENHPKLLGPRCFAFADRLRARGARLEVALGVETIHPEAMRRIGKRVTRDDLARAADRLRDADIALRAFVLIGAPYVPVDETLDWIDRSVAFALDRGADHVALIPVRGGNGAMERLRAAGDWTPPRFDHIEQAFVRARAIVRARRGAGRATDVEGDDAGGRGRR